MIMIFGFLFTVFAFVFVGAASGMVGFFVDFPSALLILVPLAFFLPVSKSGVVIGRYIRSSFKRDYQYGERELAALSLVMSRTVKFILALGGFGFVAGLIGCLANLGAPERLGPNLAVSLITLIYSFALGFFVFFPVQVWAENKLTLLSKTER